MAGKTITVRIALEGSKVVKAELEEIGAAGKDAAKNLNDAAKQGDFAGGFESQFDRVKKAAQDMRVNLDRSFAQISAGIKDFTRTAATIGAVVGGIGTALFGLTKSAANAADAVRDAGLRTGTSAEEFQKLRHGMQLSGVSADKAESIFGRLNDAIGEAQEKGKTSTGAFERIGVALTDASGKARPITAILSDVADKMTNIQNPVDRAALAVQLFGRRAGPQMVEFLSSGSKGIKEFGADAVRLGAVITTAETKIGDDFNDALFRVGASASGTSTKLGLLFAPALTEAANRFAKSMAEMQPKLLELGQAIASKVAPIIKDITSALVGEPDKIQSGFISTARAAVVALGTALTTVLVPAFQGWKIILDTVAQAFNALFGTGLGAADIAAFLVSFRLVIAAFTIAVGVVNSLAAVFGVLRVAMLALTVTPLGLAITAIVLALGLLIAAVVKSGVTWEDVKKVWTNVITSIGNFVKGLVETFNSTVKAITGFFTGLGEFVLGIFKKILDGAKKVIDAVKNAVSGKPAAAAEGGAVQFARGGFVRGSGTSTSDSIWARLSDREFVVRAKAVDHFGVDFFHALNQLRNPFLALSRGFHLGGLVDRLSSVMPSAPRFADGGLVVAGAGGNGSTFKTPVNINIGNESFAALMSGDEIMRLMGRTATLRSITSTGRKPTWYRG
jgi:hypothetical protein